MTSNASEFQRILVGFDGSEHAARAVQMALELASEIGSETVILSVLPSLSHLETDEERRHESRRMRELLGERLHPYWAEAEVDSVKFIDLPTSDDPAEAIASYANEHGFDLLIVGRARQDHLTHRGVSRGLDTLLKLVPCPVLVV